MTSQSYVELVLNDCIIPLSGSYLLLLIEKPGTHYPDGMKKEVIIRERTAELPILSLIRKKQSDFSQLLFAFALYRLQVLCQPPKMNILNNYSRL